MNTNEGYIKFKCNQEKKGFFFSGEAFNYINNWRQTLYNHELIGAYDNGIGFGNLSIRIDSTNCFIISGSATGNYAELNKSHYAKVIDYDVNDNYVKCVGEIKASSESLTHAVLYEVSPTINAVIHTHNKKLWEELLHSEPTTSPGAEFGTPELALEIKRLVNHADALDRQIIIMGGHEEGIITFGKDLEDAGNVLLDYQNKIINQK